MISSIACGDGGLRWTQEVRVWLLAWGINSGKVRLIPGRSALNIIEFLVNEKVMESSIFINPSLVIKERS